MTKEKTIILIGPVSVGKTTISTNLSKILKIPTASIDQYRLSYYKEIGYSENHKEEILDNLGWAGVYRYWKVFDSHSVVRFVEDFPNHILDFGGGSTVCEFPEEFDKIQKCFNPYANVFLLMPFEDRIESLKFLNKRTGWKMIGRNINRHIIENYANYKLAKHIIYTGEKNTEEICLEILKKYKKD